MPTLGWCKNLESKFLFHNLAILAFRLQQNVNSTDCELEFKYQL
jgi:hypothetical protein